ncbi:MAG: diadenylate cyclase CdaA [Bacteroidia bacterium]|nr:diadenylate cyclase CdaA [Bacteroidia bacterium]
MIDLFIHVRFLDIIDILLVTIIFYEIYKLVKGTVAFNIFMGIFIIFVVWLVVKSLKMELLGSILGQLFGVGVIAIIIVFQQEVRRFLLMLGSRYRSNRQFTLENLFSSQFKLASEASLHAIVDACRQMSENRVGALIVLARESELKEYVETGEIIDAEISSELIRSIFFKNSPLHDGAMIVSLNRIKAARCILPVSQKLEINPVFGLRHRAAIGISEQTDAYVIVVSEETGRISMSSGGELNEGITTDELFKILESSHK